MKTLFVGVTSSVTDVQLTCGLSTVAAVDVGSQRVYHDNIHHGVHHPADNCRCRGEGWREVSQQNSQ